MAHINRSSGATQYLINGMRPVRGNKLATLDEIKYFYDHYDEFLTKTETTFTHKQDAIIVGLTNDESRLERQLRDTTSRQTIEVDKKIDDLYRMITLEKSFFPRIGNRLQYWIAVALRNHHINAPGIGISRELQTVRNRKENCINEKQSLIQTELNNIKSSYDFLKANETFLIGSVGEEAVIDALSRLSD